MRNNLHPKPAIFEPSLLLATKAEWLRLYNQRIAKIQEWQCLETQMYKRAKEDGIGVEAFLESDGPKAQAMKALDVQIEALGQQADDLALGMLSQPAGSLAEAVAKIEVGLTIQGPHDWQPCAMELIAEGVDALRKHLG